jgi:hypothetical protein
MSGDLDNGPRCSSVGQNRVPGRTAPTAGRRQCDRSRCRVVTAEGRRSARCPYCTTTLTFAARVGQAPECSAVPARLTGGSPDGAAVVHPPVSDRIDVPGPELSVTRSTAGPGTAGWRGLRHGLNPRDGDIAVRPTRPRCTRASALRRRSMPASLRSLPVPDALNALYTPECPDAS